MDGDVAFRKTRKAMSSVGILQSTQAEIFKLLSAILHLNKVSSNNFFILLINQ